MVKQQKKQKLSSWKAAQRESAREALPMPDGALEALFNTLDLAFRTNVCDHTRRLTLSWLEDNGHTRSSVTSWLDETGGYCDCEVLANSEPAWRYATGRD